jgi:hypothetical protein
MENFYPGNAINSVSKNNPKPNPAITLLIYGGVYYFGGFSSSKMSKGFLTFFNWSEEMWV